MSNAKRGSIRNWLKNLMFRHLHGMMTCQEFEDFIQAYMDNDLTTIQRSVFEKHLRFCRECRDYLAAYKKTIEIGYSVLTAPEDPVPGDVPEDLIKAILEAREQ